MDKRERQRKKRRISCELQVDGKAYPGIVMDFSAAGLFVQTRARPRPDTPVTVTLRPEGGAHEIHLNAAVARARVVPTGLQAAMPGGVGLLLEDPPPELLELFADTAGANEEMSDAAAAVRTFRVRVKQLQGPGARVITVRCESAQAARARALKQVGRGWKVAEVKEL